MYNVPTEAFTRDFVGRWNQFEAEVRNGMLETPFGTFDELPSEIRERYFGEVLVFVRPTDIGVARGRKEIRQGAGTLQFTGVVVADGVTGEMYEVTATFGDGRQTTVQTAE